MAKGKFHHRYTNIYEVLQCLLARDVHVTLLKMAVSLEAGEHSNSEQWHPQVSIYTIMTSMNELIELASLGDSVCLCCLGCSCVNQGNL